MTGRIWITGVGMVTALGRTVEATWERVVAGERGFRDVTLFDTGGCRTSVAGEIPHFAVADVASADEARSWSRTDAMAVSAAREAARSAGLGHGDRLDLVVGGTTAGMYETEAILAELHAGAVRVEPPERMLSHPLSATMDRLVDALGGIARARALCSACSSGANALILAAAWLRTGRSTRVLAGGADGLCRVTFTGFNSLGALSPEPCRPFDVERQGLTLGEGAAFLVVETEEAARARGAAPLVELAGWAVGAEAHHITNPEPTGATAAAVMTEALERAGLAPGDIDYVNAHGTATKLNDAMESAAIRTCFGEHADRLPVSSTKGQLGHTLGAAGAVEAILTAMSVARGIVPPTVGLDRVDPACQLAHVREARELPIRAAMSNSFGFGGSDAVVIFRAPDPGEPPTRAPSTGAQRVLVTGVGVVGPAGIGHSSSADAYLSPAEQPPAGEIPFEAADHLDVGRARRLDRGARLAAAAMAFAIDEAGWGESEQDAGAVLGGAFGAVDACSAFLHRIHDKGPRFASPAVFPNLLPSSAVAQASIYHRLRGPVLATADLEASGESALVTAVELVAAGQASRLVAGGAEPASDIAEAVLAPLCRSQDGGAREGDADGSILAAQRSEGAAVVALETASSARGRGVQPLAEVVWTASWRGDPRQHLVGLEAPSGRHAVFHGRGDTGAPEALECSSWASAPSHVLSHAAGRHESVGAFAMAAAVRQVARGELDEALVVGAAAGGGAAILIRAAAPDVSDAEEAGS